MTVKTANTAPASVVNAPTVSGGGSSGATASDAIPIVTDACPNGWGASEKVQFGPPVPAVDSGVLNVERPDGCTVLDKIWEAEPFASHDAFVAHVRSVVDDFSLSGGERDAIVSAATQSLVGTTSDHQVDNSCTNRVAFTFDDGPSYYRPRTLQYFRDKQVHGDFFDLGMRAEANPQIERFAVREGHVLLSHTYNHTDMNALSDAAKIEEIQHNEAVFNAIGAPFTFKGIRTPFGSANAHTQEVVAAQGYTYFLTRIETGEDYEPDVTAQETTDSIVSKLRPGAIIGIHDGPIDTPAGLATSDAVPMIIDRGRAMGYCFGKVDRSGQVVADRYVSSGEPIPQAVNPVPYNFLERAGTPPADWFVAPDALGIDATHTPAVFTRGGTGKLSIVVSNLTDQPSDPDPVGGSTVTVNDAVPRGLTVTSVSGQGWTCSGSAHAEVHADRHARAARLLPADRNRGERRRGRARRGHQRAQVHRARAELGEHRQRPDLGGCDRRRRRRRVRAADALADRGARVAWHLRAGRRARLHSVDNRVGDLDRRRRGAHRERAGQVEQRRVLARFAAGGLLRAGRLV